MYKDNQYPAPDPTVTLCFGEEFTDFSTAKNKLIIVQVNGTGFLKLSFHYNFNYNKLFYV